jgi:hypothetical protein
MVLAGQGWDMKGVASLHFDALTGAIAGFEEIARRFPTPLARTNAHGLSLRL